MTKVKTFSEPNDRSKATKVSASAGARRAATSASPAGYREMPTQDAEPEDLKLIESKLVKHRRPPFSERLAVFYYAWSFGYWTWIW
jgi:hypothetical protein